MLDQARRRELARTVPERCGVYLFLGAHGAPLYIGKAVNLRRRVQQHLRAFAPAAGARGGRRASLLARFERIDWIPCPTELHALLLEDELIKRHLPPCNRRQKQYLRDRFLAFSGGPFPALRLLDREDAVGEPEVFGPFRSGFAARGLMEIARRYLHLCDCPAALPGRPCVRSSLGLCAVPCAGAETAPSAVQAYSEVVRRTRALLLGDAQELAALLQERMERFSRERRFELAAQVRDQLQLLRRHCARQLFQEAFRTRPLLLHSRGTWPGTYLFLGGRLAGYTPELLGRRGWRVLLARARDGEPELPPFDPANPLAPLPRQVLHDRALILATWRQLDPDRRTLRFLEG